MNLYAIATRPNGKRNVEANLNSDGFESICPK